MKFIISPSKTQNIVHIDAFHNSKPVFCDMADAINNTLKKYDLDHLKSIYKTSDTITEQTYKHIQLFDTALGGQAIFSYTGLVYKEICASTLNQQEISFLNDHLLILSAYYGVLKPLDSIKPYRLDFNTKIDDIEVKSIWREKVNKYLNRDVVINLASNEFSSLINKDMINITFKEYRNKQLRVISTPAKMARGKMINIIAKNKIDNIEHIKDLEINDYTYNDLLSDGFNYVFTK